MRPLDARPGLSYALFGALAVVPIAALIAFGTGGILIEPGVHLAVVTVTALVAFQAAIGLSIVGYRHGDGRSVMIGTAFVVMASLLAVHGFATPTILIGPNGLVAFAAGATLPAGAILIGLSAHPLVRKRRAAEWLMELQIGLVAIIAAIGVVGMTIPDALPAAPLADSTSALALLGFGSLCLGALAWRSARTFLLTRRPGDAMVGVGVVWLGAALGSAATFNTTEFGWWLGHGLELLGIATITIALAVDLRRAAPSRALTGDLEAVELVVREEEFLGPQVRALLLDLAEKDGHTELHTRRVAMRAAQVGEELGLAPSALRKLALGGLLHDIGKLAVPRAILQKPDVLTDAEFALIKRHPENGASLLAELGGFSGDVRALVRDHHERLDGSGYPNGANAEQLSVGARILGVCDVYDALVSDRVYRPAWTNERAISHLRFDCSGQFDGRAVEALAAVVERELPSEVTAEAPGRQVILREHEAEAQLQELASRATSAQRGEV
ncbi:MAG: HD-GYP domain-containing protein [Gaiellaceae bacterium]